MIYIKTNEKLYPATISGKMTDREWDNRESKAITLEMDYVTANALFVDGLTWSIVQQEEVTVETGTEIKETEWDNSEFMLAGDITDHRDGTITVKMGKLTDLEEAYEILLGGAE
jgi:hypothetical protein